MRIDFTTVAVLLVSAQAACHSGLRRRANADAGGAGSPDVALGASSVDLAAGADVAGADRGADLAGLEGADAGALGTSKGFRIVNASDSTAYIDYGDPVGCRSQDASGWQACQFLVSPLSCPMLCQSVQPGDPCCVYCEQPTPTLLAVPSGGSRTIAWTGSLVARRANYCSDCECQEQFPAGPGTYEATVRAWGQYACVWGQPCPEQADGVIPYAAPQGSYQESTTRFSIPSADEMVVITIPGELSVSQVVANTDALLGAPLIVVGKVLPDIRQKLLSWPPPVLSFFILQDGGDVAGYSTSPPSPYLQLYSTSDLMGYLEQQVRVTAYLRSVPFEYMGQSSPFFYLDVLSIAAI